MANFKQPGATLDLTAPAGGVTAGSFYLIGGIVVFAAATAAAAAQFPAINEGAFDECVANTGTAWAEGDTLYWDDTNSRFTKTTSGNTKCGIATAAKASGTAVGAVKLIPSL